MSENTLKPIMRFKGFNDDWEQRKLDEVSSIYDGTHQTPKYQDEGVMFLSVENIKTLTSNKFISRDAFESEFKIRPQKNDVLMTRIGDIGTANVVESDEDLAYYVSLALFKSENLNPYFLKASIHAPFVQDQIWKRTLHIAFPKKINKNEIGQVPINIPKFEEQVKIGKFFQEVDKAITLHQHELTLIKQRKKAFLQKMFPKKGESIPKISFPKFTKPWESKKIGDLMDVTSVKRIHQSDWTKDGVKFLRARDIVANFKNITPENNLYISEEKYKEYSRASGKVSVGDLLVTGVGSIGIPMLIENDDPIYFKDGNIIWFKNNDIIDANFLYYSFIRSEIQNYIRSIAGIGTVGTYTITSGKQTPIKLPSRHEQQKIGNFFKQLDEDISLHEQNLEKLKEMKKAFLQKMFV